ncbi:glycine cleavage system aminomethyltransferase GcvT [Vagococcus carniphilus]|uniref:glycine cleavage system aminomethyltransferase GcvT n=1 Tax=Vagococcus carniphilus TaxID=218144 RepID=UPI002891E188|nr:glycine cleavage system aminomethyltransferase GcvT [Vagococcus carniphilus]MDT2847706.1 glycine cleavage system aminomethyltransferase GcvT [Vagococcus carniphilus]
MDKKTPLYEAHVALKGKMVPFGGYSLPVQYADAGLVKEHMAVRESVGLFDVSHMGEIFIQGSDALKNVQNLFTNDFEKMKAGQIRYTVMCNESGGIIDDLILYKYNDEKFMGVVNASNKEKDFEWIKNHLTGDVEAVDSSDDIGLIAIQGPKARATLEKLVEKADFPEKYYTFKEQVDFKGMKVDLSETGYTGEEGFEVYTKAEDVEKIWHLLIEAGEEFNIQPCGLGARDTLRLEAGMPLYGHEMSESINPLQVGLQFAVKMKKDGFIGKEALEKATVDQVRVGLKITGKGIVREEVPIFVEDKQIGMSTSGTHAPFLKYAIAMALIDKDYAEIGQVVEAEVRGRRVQAEVIPMPFYKK